MTPKEKARELVDKFIERNYDLESFFGDERPENAKKCALICADEILKTLNNDIRDLDVRGNILLDLIDYWKVVKNEIEKL